ncbi:hypothetical protein Tco_0952076 [Tanacetum coccineum]|uniref:Uncharacterized protein n=1 Tax=Tanacetum coccineum TaxID=301880 RepID=A0ABQ5DVW6_9ASTR
MVKIYNLRTDLVDFADMDLPARDQRHQYLRFAGLQYTDTDITDFEERLGRIYDREVHRVQVFDFGGLTELMDERLRGRMLMERRDAKGQSVFTSRAWRRLFEIRGPLVHELILEFFSTFRFGEVVLDLDTAGALQFQLGGVRCRRATGLLHEVLLGVRLFASGRKSGAKLSGGHFIGRLAQHFGLVSDDGLRGLSVMTRSGEAASCCGRCPRGAKDAPDVDEGAQAVPAPIHAPPPPPQLQVKSKANDVLLKNLKAKFKWVKTQAEKLGVSPLPQLTAFRFSNSEKKRKRTSEIIKAVFVKENIMVDGMHRNMTPPPQVMPSEGLVIKEPKACIFFYNGNFDLVFQREEEFHLATTPQLIKIQNSTKLNIEIAEDMYQKMILAIKARDDVVEARKIVQFNLDQMGQN